MMTRRSKGAITPGLMVAPIPNTHLRTYSRRSLKRRNNSLPAQPVERLLTRTGSLDLTEQTNAELKTAEQRSKTKTRHLARHSSNRARNSLELLTSASKTPNDLTRKALASSGPVSTWQDDDSPEGRPDEAHVVKCSPGQERSEHQQLAVEYAQNSSTRSRRGSIGGDIGGNATSDVDSPGRESLEGSDGFEDGSSDFVQDTEPGNTALTSSSQGEGITIPNTLGGRKAQSKGRFLVFDKSPPEGFKMLYKPRVNPDAEPGIKRKRPMDGFTVPETRPIFLGKRRRLQHLDINVGSLDLTQTSIASQQKPKNTSPGSKMRPQTRTAAGIRRRPQYFGTSQFALEPQDSVEPPELKITPIKTPPNGA